MIGIINYGSGNLSAFLNIYKSLEKKVMTINDPEDLKLCSHIIMPGVSSWDTTMQSVNRFRDVLITQVINNKVPFLGVCVGMQILASTSEEGTCDGLNWIEGKVMKLPTDLIADNPDFLGPKLPHMGWNSVNSNEKADLMKGLPQNPEFYFLHSFYFEASNKEDVISTAEHNFFKFPVIVQNDNIFGVQFHPEKSHMNGKMLLDNFTKL